MKKLLALILTALLLLSGALAEEQTVPAQGWHIVLDEVTITVENETVALNPSLDVILEKNAEGYWAQLGIVNGDAPAAGLHIEYYGDAILASAEGAQDTLIIDGADMFLTQYELTGEEIRYLLDMILAGISEGGLDALASDPGLAEEGMTIEVAAAGSEYVLTYAEPGASISAHLVIEPYADGIPFDLTAKNLCAYTFREMFPGDGTDIPDTLTASLSALLADETVSAAAALLDIEL